MDWGNSQDKHEDTMPEVIKTVRKWYFGVADGIWAKSSSVSSRAHVEMMHDRLLQDKENAKPKPS
jgi:hypothetical protein